MVILINDISEEIYEKNKHLLCTKPEETIKATQLMSESVTQLENHATSKDDYKYVGEYPYYNLLFYKKKHQGHTKVDKFQYKIRKIVRVYNPNLVMIQQRFKSWGLERQKYFYALATKVEISKDKAIIAMNSANINDRHPSKKEYKNTIIENKNLFKTDIDSEDYIKQGKLKKTFLNLAGYIIEKKDKHIDINYIEGDSCI
ncbi:fam-a protein, fragment [Plasmodium vinckei brucechwatti]|uniref:Fam-a protein n=1 Tax=Plasmodium vinckei brucechwatti TaxID=119398 RepID=A0A6V7S5I8_PLAVN|nr:fam-a protein, fragment [Plasmodium vinckei brucechwatti]